MKVAVLGAGDAGVCLAASIATRGPSVALWNRSISRLEALQAEGVLLRRLGGPAITVGMHFTPSIQVACCDADLVFVVVSSDAQAQLVATNWNTLRRAEAIVVIPAHTGGALSVLHAVGGRRRAIAEMPLPFVARRVDDVYAILAMKATAPVAVTAGGRIPDRILNLVRAVIPTAVHADSILASMLSNTVAVLQPALMWANADEITYGELDYIYTDGMTSEAVEMITGLEVERLQLANKLGVQVPGVTDWFTKTYRIEGRDIRQAVGNCAAFKTIPAPASMDHRFAIEHVRTGAVPLSQLARAVGTEHEYFDTLIQGLSNATGIDLAATGRSLRDMGLDGTEGADGIRNRIKSLTGAL